MNHSPRLRGLLIMGALFSVAGTLHADTLILRNGRRVEGQLVSFQRGVIQFQEAAYGGRIVRIDRNDVTAIELGRVERVQPALPQAPQARRPRGLREKQIIVVANAAWTDTGIELRAGQNVYFEAGGEIRWGPNRRALPAGELNSPNNPARPIPNRPGAALIGSVGDSNDFFFVGDDRTALRVRNSGRLYLGINDDYLQDNTGYFTVIVYY